MIAQEAIPNNISGVYGILNTKNGKIYIGSSVRVKARWRSHIGFLRKGKHHSIKLQRAWNKYGEDVFSSILIRKTLQDRSSLLVLEKEFIKIFNSKENGYNICSEPGSCLGMKRSIKTRKLISVAVKLRNSSKEERERISKMHKGKIISEETRDKMRIAAKKRASTEEFRSRISKLHKGKITSQDTKTKISTSVKNTLDTKRSK